MGEWGRERERDSLECKLFLRDKIMFAIRDSMILRLGFLVAFEEISIFGVD